MWLSLFVFLKAFVSKMKHERQARAVGAACTLCHCLIVWPWASPVITLGPCFPALKLVQ